MTASTPLVSIIIPAYKQAEYISDALDSVLKQDYACWEAIVVDDGSPDNVADIVAPYCAADSRIQFVHTENHGVSAARNKAVSLAKGEFILPLDADDTIEPTYIGKAVEQFRLHPEAEVVYCKWRFFGVTTDAPELAYTTYRNLLVNNSIFATAMFRRSRFLAIGGYDEDMHLGFEDWEMWMRLLDDSSVVIQIPEHLFNYRIKTASRNVTAADDNSGLNAFAIELYMMDKHKKAYKRYFGLPTVFYETRFQLEDQYRNLKKKYDRIWYRRLWRAIRPKRNR